MSSPLQVVMPELVEHAPSADDDAPSESAKAPPTSAVDDFRPCLSPRCGREDLMDPGERIWRGNIIEHLLRTSATGGDASITRLVCPETIILRSGTVMSRATAVSSVRSERWLLRRLSRKFKRLRLSIYGYPCRTVCKIGRTTRDCDKAMQGNAANPPHDLGKIRGLRRICRRPCWFRSPVRTDALCGERASLR